VKHTASAFRNGLCGCVVCRNAHRDRSRLELVARRERTAANGGVAPVAQHNRSTYSNWGCRCGDCLADVRAHYRRVSP